MTSLPNPRYNDSQRSELYYLARTTAIRHFFGSITEEQWPKYKCNVWYVPTKNKCQSFEPEPQDDDGYTVALSHDTVYRALFNSNPLPRTETMHGTPVRNSRK